MVAPARAVFAKLANRKDQAISVVHAAVALSFDGEAVSTARLALGSVAPTVVRVDDAEAALIGRALTDETIAAAARTAARARCSRSTTCGRPASTAAASPRSSSAGPCGHSATGVERSRWPSGRRVSASPPRRSRCRDSVTHRRDDVVVTEINGHQRSAANATGRSLLDWLRADAGAAGDTPLTGAKEGCAEGECGACTVHLDGRAVLACLVPAARAHGRADHDDRGTRRR